MKKAVVIALAAVAVAATSTSAILAVNLVNEKEKFTSLFNYESAVCEYERYESQHLLPEGFEYQITCDEAIEYELQDYIECSKDKGSYCTVDDLI